MKSHELQNSEETATGRQHKMPGKNSLRNRIVCDCEVLTRPGHYGTAAWRFIQLLDQKHRKKRCTAENLNT